MLKRAVALALVLVAATAMARPAKRHGKRGRVVRVERGRTRGHGAARVCTNADSQGNSYCYGVAPRIGDEGTVLDGNGVHGEEELTGVTEQQDACGNVTYWMVTATARGDISQLSYGLVVFDGDLAPTARTIDTTNVVGPGAYPGEVTMTAVDNDGDSDADLLVTYYYCDTSGTPQGAGSQSAYCLVYYGDDGSGILKQQRVDIVKMCF